MSKTDRRSYGDAYTGVTLLVLCAVAFGLTMTFRDVPSALSQNVPPTFFPRLVLVVISVLSSALVVRGVRRPGAVPKPVTMRVVVTGCILAVSVALVPTIGMRVTVALLSIVLPYYWGERRALRIAALAIATPLTIHLVFAVALGLRLPRGLLF